MKVYFNYSLIFLLLSLYCLVSCSESMVHETMNRADVVMESNPDSALNLLKSIDKMQLSGKRENARYAILMSMALDKNYVDTTTFDIIQPAIDYFLENGTPDEKLRTFYYSGRIYYNKGEGEKALNSFVKSIELAPNASDSLTMARAFVAAACLFYEFHDFRGYVNNFLQAASIYKGLSRNNDEYDCLVQAFNGAIIMENKHLSDSLYNAVNSNYDLLDISQASLLKDCSLSYITTFGTEQEITDFVERLDSRGNSNPNTNLNLALAYEKTGNHNQAGKLLDAVADSGIEYDTLKYLAIAVPVLKSMGNYKDALTLYENFSQKNNMINLLKFDLKAKSMEEKHLLEIRLQEESQHKSHIILISIGIFVILSLGISILMLLVRSNKERNRQLLMERDMKAIEAENLSHRVESLENERDTLNSLIETKKELPSNVKEEINIRIEMLNSLLASHISGKNKYAEPYNEWIKEVVDNKEEFMNSNRLAFQASHPNFIKYFADHGLTLDEINYLCLYAIGLTGRDIGGYMKMRSHVNISSGIRKKLGLDSHQTNIGIYVRKLLKKL